MATDDEAETFSEVEARSMGSPSDETNETTPDMGRFGPRIVSHTLDPVATVRRNKRQKLGTRPSDMEQAKDTATVKPVLSPLLKPGTPLYTETATFDQIYANRCIQGTRYKIDKGEDGDGLHQRGSIQHVGFPAPSCLQKMISRSVRVLRTLLDAQWRPEPSPHKPQT